MLSVSFRVWTRVAVSFSNDNNHYTTGTLSLKIYINGFISEIIAVFLAAKLKMKKRNEFQGFYILFITGLIFVLF